MKIDNFLSMRVDSDLLRRVDNLPLTTVGSWVGSTLLLRSKLTHNYGSSSIFITNIHHYGHKYLHTELWNKVALLGCVYTFQRCARHCQKFIIASMVTGRMGTTAILPIRWSVTIGIMLEFDGDGHGVGMCKHSFKVSIFIFKVALVGQEPVLYARSIRENIAYGLEACDPERVEDAARNANAHEFIMEMKDKYDTEAGEKGAQLSGKTGFLFLC